MILMNVLCISTKNVRWCLVNQLGMYSCGCTIDVQSSLHLYILHVMYICSSGSHTIKDADTAVPQQHAGQYSYSPGCSLQYCCLQVAAFYSTHLHSCNYYRQISIFLQVTTTPDVYAVKSFRPLVQTQLGKCGKNSWLQNDAGFDNY